MVLFQSKSSRELLTEIRNDQPRIVEIQFCLTKFLCKMCYWIERLVLCLLTSCLTRRKLCCETIRSIFFFYCDNFVLLTVGFLVWTGTAESRILPILKLSISSPPLIIEKLSFNSKQFVHTTDSKPSYKLHRKMITVLYCFRGQL